MTNGKKIKMTTHEKTMQLIKALDYNTRQIAQVLEISTKGAEKKIKLIESNKFTDKNLLSFIKFINNLNKLAEKTEIG